MPDNREFMIFMERAFGTDWQDKTIAELMAECPVVPDHTLLQALEHYRELKAVELSNLKNAEAEEPAQPDVPDN